MPSNAAHERIVIVEDDEAVLNSLDFMFTAAGYRVSPYATVFAAMASPDLADAVCLIVDYALPDGDGLSLLQEQRSKGVRTPAILIASTPSTRCRQQAREAGIPLMEKPLDGDSLNAWVAMLAAKSRDADQSEPVP